MVEKIIVSPKQVRGGGNIISPSKNPNDYTGYLSQLSESTDTVNGLPATVFDLTVNSDIIGKFEINNQGHLIFTLEGNANISFSINNQGHLICTGDNENNYTIENGHCIYGA